MLAAQSFRYPHAAGLGLVTEELLPAQRKQSGAQRPLILNQDILSPGNGSAGKESACNAGDRGDTGLIPRSGKSPGGGNGNPLQYSCLENPMDRGAWQAIIHGVAKSGTRLND